MKILIQAAGQVIETTLFETPTAKAIYNTLPYTGKVNTWGDEIYFGIPVQADPEPDAVAEVSIGDLAYWPTMPAFCIFFGPTPVSYGDTPVAASPVNVFGRLSNINIEQLRGIHDGEIILIKKAE